MLPGLTFATAGALSPADLRSAGPPSQNCRVWHLYPVSAASA